FRSSWGNALSVPGIDTLPTLPTGGPYIDGVSADYFKTLGIRITKGRGLDARDVRGAPRAVVVGETMASMLWPGQNPLGKCMKVGGDTMPCSEVVGVSADAQREGFESGARMQYYVASAQDASNPPSALFVRTNGEPVSLIDPVRSAM